MAVLLHARFVLLAVLLAVAAGLLRAAFRANDGAR